MMPDAEDTAELLEEFLWLAQSCEGECYESVEPKGKGKSHTPIWHQSEQGYDARSRHASERGE